MTPQQLLIAGAAIVLLLLEIYRGVGRGLLYFCLPVYGLGLLGVWLAISQIPATSFDYLLGAGSGGALVVILSGRFTRVRLPKWLLVGLLFLVVVSPALQVADRMLGQNEPPTELIDLVEQVQTAVDRARRMSTGSDLENATDLEAALAQASTSVIKLADALDGLDTAPHQSRAIAGSAWLEFGLGVLTGLVGTLITTVLSKVARR